jgi:cephalosporin-C deacetylase-like acetyl esterase
LRGEQSKAEDPVPFQVRDYEVEKPVSDQVFRAYKSLYSYDKTPLHAVVEVLPETDDWKEEKITFDAAYGNERVIAYLFLPKHASPPFQTIVHFNGAQAFYERSSDPLDPGFVADFDFLIKSGRALIFPVYKGTFERWDDFSSWPKASSSYRDAVIAWSKDLGRSIDYLETRPEIDTKKLAYEGTSMGGAMGALLPAVENRLKVAVLISPGFYLQKRLPEADPLNFAPRMKLPVLMVNGKYDYLFPVRASQEPMFRLLGAPANQKRRVVYDVGHDIPRSDEIRESLAWLDRYLGPVKTR